MHKEPHARNGKGRDKCILPMVFWFVFEGSALHQGDHEGLDVSSFFLSKLADWPW